MVSENGIGQSSYPWFVFCALLFTCTSLTSLFTYQREVREVKRKVRSQVRSNFGDLWFHGKESKGKVESHAKEGESPVDSIPIRL